MMQMNALRSAPALEPELPIRVTLREGRDDRTIEADEGEALLFALKRAGLPLAAVCGGKGACGTCRVHVPAAWRGRLEEPGKRELRLLAFTNAAEGDRLSCRITLGPDLEGLEIYVCTETRGNE
jgi:ferredoxin, 2Fe-2S